MNCRLAFIIIPALLLVLSACVTVDEPEDDAASRVCPKDMALVMAPAQGVRLCVDRFEASPSTGPQALAKPLFNQSYFNCKQLCASRGKRLLTNREWLVACEGTSAAQCNKNRPHPVVRKMSGAAPWRFRHFNCKDKAHAWLECMLDPSLNALNNGLARNNEFPGCVSRHGVRHMIGNLGEWVDEIRQRRGSKLGRFNGGLYPQPKSSCTYTTLAHGPNYKDYSIGCRCAKAPLQLEAPLATARPPY